VNIYSEVTKSSFMKKLLNRHLLHIAALLFVLGSSSCNKIASVLQYDLSMQTASADVIIPPLSDTTLSVAMGSISSPSNTDSFVKANTGGVLGVSNIGSAHIVSCSLTLQNPNTGNNFGNFQSASVAFFTNANTTPVTVASIAANPATYATALDVPVNTTADLSSYLHGNQLTYSLTGKLHNATTDTLICRVQLKLNVHVHG
jgi:hypothetical protein